jgi:hypothetical protein
LTSSPTQSLGPPRLRIGVQEAYEIGFGLSTYALKDDEVSLPMASVTCPNKIELYQNCPNNFNIQSPTHPRAVHIKIDAQVVYGIQLGCSCNSWKGKERTFPMELISCQNSSAINKKCQKMDIWNLSWCCTTIFGLWAVYHE